MYRRFLDRNIEARFRDMQLCILSFGIRVFFTEKVTPIISVFPSTNFPQGMYFSPEQSLFLQETEFPYFDTKYCLGWHYRSPKSPLAIKNCSWQLKTPKEQILAIKKFVLNKIADHEFHIVFGHFTLPSLQIKSLQTLSPRTTGHIYLRYTINTLCLQLI